MKTVSPLICRQFVLVIVMDGFKYATWLVVCCRCFDLAWSIERVHGGLHRSFESRNGPACTIEAGRRMIRTNGTHS